LRGETRPAAAPRSPPVAPLYGDRRQVLQGAYRLEVAVGQLDIRAGFQGQRSRLARSDTWEPARSAYPCLAPKWPAGRASRPAPPPLMCCGRGGSRTDRRLGPPKGTRTLRGANDGRGRDQSRYSLAPLLERRSTTTRVGVRERFWPGSWR
jgi:hypothetical protein